MAVAAHACRALRPDLADAFARAFKRDVTVSNYRFGAACDVLGLSYRRGVRTDFLPGRVVCALDDDRDKPGDEALAALFARGGTFICEGTHGLAHARRCGVSVEERALTPGRVEVAGPAISRWRVSPSIAWIDAGAVALDTAAETLVRDDAGPLVVRIPIARGSLVRLGWTTAPFRREAPPGPQTTHRAFAQMLQIEPRGVLATETPIDLHQASAATLMLGVVADILADAA